MKINSNKTAYEQCHKLFSVTTHKFSQTVSQNICD